jgi:hypothetical protein
MNKEQALSKIKEAEQTIKELKKYIGQEESKNVRWRAEKGGIYYYFSWIWCDFNERKDAIDDFDDRDDFDDNLYNLGNYFKTKQEALDYGKRIKLEQQLKDIALRLNGGIEIDWKSRYEKKWYIFYDYSCKCFGQDYNSIEKQCKVYCFNRDFIKVALEEIGEKDLKFLFGVKS